MNQKTLPETNFCDEKLFGEIYDSHHSKVYNFVLRITGDPHLSEDLTQDIFVQVYQKYSSFRGMSSLQTWIFAIAKNTAFTHLRRIRRSSFGTIEQLIEEASTPVKQGQYTEFERRIYVEQVKEGCLLGLLRSLSLNQRLAFILNVFSSVSFETIALIIGKSPNAARILVHRARRNLRRFLCKNCSLYDESNPCRCENLISFSLNRGWIGMSEGSAAAVTIESEIHAVRDEITLYRSLHEHHTPQDLADKIKRAIISENLRIFSAGKVK